MIGEAADGNRLGAVGPAALQGILSHAQDDELQRPSHVDDAVAGQSLPAQAFQFLQQILLFRYAVIPPLIVKIIDLPIIPAPQPGRCRDCKRPLLHSSSHPFLLTHLPGHAALPLTAG